MIFLFLIMCVYIFVDGFQTFRVDIFSRIRPKFAKSAKIYPAFIFISLRYVLFRIVPLDKTPVISSHVI